MQITIQRSLKIPLATQIKEQVILAIANGELQVGEVLPSIRQLADFLGINRNTVAQSYRALEQEGYVMTRAGGGTLVVDSPATRNVLRSRQLRSFVHQMLTEAEAQGFNVLDVGQVAYYESLNWQRVQPSVSVLLLDLYQGELDLFCTAVSTGLQADVQGLLIDDVERLGPKERAHVLATYDFAVVPFYCFERARALLGDLDLPLLSMGVGPSLSTLLQIAHIPRERRVVIVCTEPSGVVYMEEALRAGDITFPLLRKVSLRDAELADAVGWGDTLIVSQGAEQTIRHIAPEKSLIVYATIINEASLATLRSYADQWVSKATKEIHGSASHTLSN